MEERINDIEKRLKKVETINKWGIVIISMYVSWYFIFKVTK